MFLLVPGMCVLISWLPAANQDERAWESIPGLLIDRGSEMSLRFLLYQTRLIMTNEVPDFLWWGGKTDGQTSDQISLISSGNQFKSSSITKILNLQKKAEWNTKHRKADVNFAYDLSLKAKV